MKTRYKKLITILVTVLLYVIIVEVDNYFEGDLRQASIRSAASDPNGCWNKVDSENRTPCRIEHHIFMGGLFHHTILPLAGLFLGISVLVLVPYIILKKNEN